MSPPYHSYKVETKVETSLKDEMGTSLEGEMGTRMEADMRDYPGG